MKRLPRWLSRWKLATLAAVGVATIVAILWYNRYVWRTVTDQIPMQAAAAGDVTVGSVWDWTSSRTAHAAALARVLSARPESVAPQAADGTLRVFVEEGSFESGAILDRANRVVSSFVSPDAPANDRLDAARTIGRGADSAGVRVQLGEQSRAIADFTAPIVSHGSAVGRVVLRATFGPDSWKFLHAMAAQPNQGRTVVVAVQGDSALVVAVRDSMPVAGRPRAMLRSDLPPFVQQALNGKRSQGVGGGIYGTRAFYAAVPTVGLPWAVVREYDLSEIDARLGRALFISDSIITLIGVLIVGVLAVAWRMAYLRRENAAAQLRSDFVSSVSHELRTPLTQIRMYAEMLQKGLLPAQADADRAMHVIEKEAERLSLLVDKVLNFTSLRRNIQRMDAEPLSVADALREAATAFAPLAAERGARVVVDVRNGTRGRIGAEALHQIMLNLLENAVKYGPRGQTIRVGAVEYSDLTRLWVDDEGPGVPVAERESIWRAFHRGAQAEGSGETGSGIGLAVVRELALQHGGRAYVKSAPGPGNGAGKSQEAGARFVVEFPAGGAKS